MRRASTRRGQLMVEAALILVAAALVFMMMAVFLRAGISSRIKVGADSMGHGLLDPR